MFLHYAFPIHCHYFESQSCSSALSSLSAAWVGGEKSRRSRSVLATSLAPPSLVEGRISPAIQRRTVLRAMPVTRTMSPARRYSVPAVMTASPSETGWVGSDQLVAAAQSIRARLDALRGARDRSARRMRRHLP